MAWVYKANMNTARYGLAGCGTQTAALSFGGYRGDDVATTESFNGTSWTNKNNMNTARNALAGCGTQTAALSFGGSPSAVTEAYNSYFFTQLNILRFVKPSYAPPPNFFPFF